MRSSYVAVAVTLVTCSLAASASAFPGNVLGEVGKPAIGSAIETVAYKRCWWNRGARSCRRYRSVYRPYYSQSSSSGSRLSVILGIQ
jgi:hypothetical protein